MLITFKTRARYPNITMFGDVAMQLLKLMGRRETVPSAIEPEDIPYAVSRLRSSLADWEEANAESEQIETNGDSEASVSLRIRAGPLIELLETAVRENVPVMWERD